ncbi:MAG TPA: pitrilysin family protein, partial [Polyangiales bacterium]|nr:pitrilysin family protein [Polyangiales bacterium]
MNRARLAFVLLLALADRVDAEAPRGAIKHGHNEGAFARSGIADWSTPPTPSSEPPFDPPHAQRFRLANGIAVLLVENHALPIVSMTLIAAGAGAAADPAGQGGLAAFTADLLDEGVNGESALAIAGEEARLGADIDIDVGPDAAEVSVDTLTSTLDGTLDLLTRIVTQPTFNMREAERVKGDLMTSLALRRDRPREVASLVLNGALFGSDSPYGHPIAGVLDEFSQLSASDARAFYRQHWSPEMMTLIVAGDVDALRLQTALQRALGAWRPSRLVLPLMAAGPGPSAPLPSAVPIAPLSRLHLVDRPDAAQTDLRIGLVGPERRDPRFFAFEVLRTVLGDGFTSRLVQRLREQLGITYGASAEMQWRNSAGPFVISSAIDTPETARGVSEILKLVDALATTDVPVAELEKSKESMIRALPAEFETNENTADAFADLVLLGLPDDFYAHYAEGVRKVTAADVRS